MEGADADKLDDKGLLQCLLVLPVWFLFCFALSSFLAMRSISSLL